MNLDAMAAKYIAYVRKVAPWRWDEHGELIEPPYMNIIVLTSQVALMEESLERGEQIHMTDYKVKIGLILLLMFMCNPGSYEEDSTFDGFMDAKHCGGSLKWAIGQFIVHTVNQDDGNMYIDFPWWDKGKIVLSEYVRQAVKILDGPELFLFAKGPDLVC